MDEPLVEHRLLSRPGFQVVMFLPLVLMMAGDLATIVANQVMIIADLNAQFSDIGLILGLQYFAQGFFTFIFGFLSDRASRKRLLVLGGFLWGISNILCSLAWSITAFGVFRLVAAVGLGVQGPVTFSILSDIFPSEQRSNSFAWWGVANMIGAAATGSIALAFNKIPTHLLDQEYGSVQEKIVAIQTQYAAEAALWRTPFLVLGICGFIFALLILFFVREPKRAAKEKQLRDILQANEEIDYSQHYTIRLSDLKIMWTRKTNFFLVINFFDNITSGIIVSYLFTYLTLELGFVLNFEDLNAQLGFLVLGLVIALGLALVGQFYFSKLGDRLAQRGDVLGRIKVMTVCAVFQIPFLALAFAIAPSVGRYTLFKGAVTVAPPVFWTIFVLMFLLVGIGLAGSFGGTPNWYATLIDGNLPEQRGTMIASATLMDTVGRALGAGVGGFFLTYFQLQGDPAPIGSMMTVTLLIFGGISALLTLPALYTGKTDLPAVAALLDTRAAELKRLATESAESNEL
jgi:MFS family permease